jgi:hypothetical protein
VATLWSCPGDDACQILHDAVSHRDVARTLGAMAWRWRWLTLGLPDGATEVVAPHLAATGEAIGAPGVAVEDLLEAIDAIDDAAVVTEAWHAAEHLYSAAGRALAGAGFIEPLTGEVAGLFAGEGLPKPAREVAEVGRRGIEGDVQRERKHHGRPSQALCIWSADVIDALAAEGHPIHPGAAGENVSVRGLDWAKVRPGSLVRLGEVEAELSGWALPCAKNRRWFRPDAREARIDPDRHPGWSRAYAYVLAGGTVHPGDEVRFS